MPGPEYEGVPVTPFVTLPFASGTKPFVLSQTEGRMAGNDNSGAIFRVVVKLVSFVQPFAVVML
jgi:hypothetical protein